MVVPVAVEHRGAKTETISLDCSSGGIAVLLDRGLDVGSDVRLTLHLDDGATVTGSASVCHCLPLGERWSVGVQFVGLPVAMQQRMVRFMAAQDRRMSRRVQVALAVEYHRAGTSEPLRHSTSSDISLGAIRFLMASPLTPGDRVELVLIIGAERFSIDGTVTGVVSDEGGQMAVVCLDRRARFRDAELAAVVRYAQDTFPSVPL